MMEALKINAVETVKVKASKGKTSKGSKPRPKHNRKLNRSEVIRAGAFFGLAVCGLCVSLPHLSSEIGMLTGAGTAAAWFLAVIIDLGMVVCKGHLSCGGANARIAWAIVGACTGLSIVMNAHAFLTHTDGLFGQVMAIVFGCFLPIFILALSYMGAEILNGRKAH